MHFYSALSTYTVLQNCLRNLENSANPDDPAILNLKSAVLFRIAELETSEPKPKLHSW